ncbi:hypothetical protein [Corynebacterium silvaticum]|uniref:Uncharacterized protein n=1 Tax=Corynebacterium silvaticum TaxID=2320431 RepID=A0ACD4Q0T1_9CORY|nr:hypothetical protein [Corynebacterium silvaticum]WCV10738.1 hypothetical protein CBE74_12275 [Corynebacterium silvaticum]
MALEDEVTAASSNFCGPASEIVLDAVVWGLPSFQTKMPMAIASVVPAAMNNRNRRV